MFRSYFTPKSKRKVEDWERNYILQFLLPNSYYGNAKKEKYSYIMLVFVVPLINVDLNKWKIYKNNFINIVSIYCCFCSFDLP